MIRLVSFTVFLATFLFGAPTWAMRPYLAADVGMAFINTESTDWGSNVSIAAGLSVPVFQMNVRGELGFSYMNISGDSFRASQNTTSESQNYVQTERYVVNFYIDMLQSYKLNPYVGIGFGYIHLLENHKYTQVNMTDGTIILNSESSVLDDAITYGLHAGTSFALTEYLLGNIGAKFFEARLNHSDKHIFSVNIGMRYMF